MEQLPDNRILKDWKERKKLLEEYRDSLYKEFGESDYNVFVFGSYITEQFTPDYSDIDLIVYCTNTDKKFKVADFSKEFWLRKGLKSDILLYTYSPDATLYFNAINQSLRITDYYPRQLVKELYTLYKVNEYEQKALREDRKYYHWYYVIKKRSKEYGRIS